MTERNEEAELAAALAEAVLGIDTLWGGDVMNPSGVGRFIADSWFSDQPLPRAYTHYTAAEVRTAGGVSAQDREAAVRAIDPYLAAVDVRGAIEQISAAGRDKSTLRQRYLASLGDCLLVMWDLAMEQIGRGEPVPYERAVRASTGRPPEPSAPTAKRERVAALLAKSGHGGGDLNAEVDAWRRERLVPKKSIRALGAAFIAEQDALTEKHVAPFLPESLRSVPRANIQFLPIEDAWFSGSMNYLGRARKSDGTPEYEATYEINAKLEISVPEFAQLVSHEVVPGHVATFALLQGLYLQGKAGFEASVLTMNTRSATLFEGIANNAILMAHGVVEVSELPDEDLQIGVLLALLQDDAKNQSSYLTWQEGWPQPEVAAALRKDFLVTEERAGKLSGAWGRHPLLGRMYLPAYRAGTDHVAELRRKHPPEKLIPALYGAFGLVDVVTIDEVL
ncbi:MAG TPA: hypothetical protein VGS22_09300 [Thermoanaerobaculia bacterium]|nr:hypothetical protein [Thermoanaerobaculia bacterium]